jgi:uncharacterized protein with HEPN domain
MPADEHTRLRHMIDVGEVAIQFLAGRSRDDLERDRMRLVAAVRAIEILGEAVSRVSAETRVALPDVPGGAIVGMRNRLMHGSFAVDAAVVWKTVADCCAATGPTQPATGHRGPAEPALWAR